MFLDSLSRNGWTPKLVNQSYLFTRHRELLFSVFFVLCFLCSRCHVLARACTCIATHTRTVAMGELTIVVCSHILTKFAMSLLRKRDRRDYCQKRAHTTRVIYE